MALVFNIEAAPQSTPSGLRLFCGADANVYVNYVASILFKDFQLSVKGQRSIAACLTNLPYTEAADSRLSFGWGPDNIVRDALVHQHGYENLAVMVALASIFHETYAAEVCHAYAATVAGEDDMLPHLRQWRRALRTGCGMLTTSEFTQLVEDYIRLDPYQIGPGSNLLAKRCRVEPQKMAAALMELSKVTRDKGKQVTLVGGAVIGWFAAFAEYFYDLKVAILSKTGEKLHGDLQHHTTQLVLVYHEEPDVHVHPDHWSTFKGKRADSDDPFWTRHIHFLPFGGRVQWNALLPQVFGRAFWVLEKEEGKTLADLVGSVARGLEGDFEHHRKNSGEDSFYNQGANASAYGAGLIENLTAWLPELRKGQGRMERQLKRSIQDATSHYEEMITQLQKRCNCSVCSTSGADQAPRDGYCLPVMCETIIALGLAISRMIVAPATYPTREGVQGLYSTQAKKRKEVKHLDLTQEANRHQHYTIVYESEWKASTARRLQNAVELFSGTRPEYDLTDSLVAIAHEGVCAYAIELLKPDDAPPRVSDRGFIQITSGFINLRQKVFTRVSTEPIKVDQSIEMLPWEEVKFKHWSKPLYCK